MEAKKAKRAENTKTLSLFAFLPSLPFLLTLYFPVIELISIKCPDISPARQSLLACGIEYSPEAENHLRPSTARQRAIVWIQCIRSRRSDRESRRKIDNKRLKLDGGMGTANW